MTNNRFDELKGSKIGIDLTRPVDLIVERPERIQLRWLQLDAEVFARMLSDFESAKPSEAIGWASGIVDVIGLGRVTRYWGCELEYATIAGAKTSPEWLARFVKRLRSEEPDHNLVLENHSHPIGSQLSRTDEDGLYALYDWSWDIFWVMTACDFGLGVYAIDDRSKVVKRIPWGVGGIWIEHGELKKRYQEKGGKLSIAKTPSITSSSPWVSRVFGKLKERSWFS